VPDMQLIDATWQPYCTFYCAASLHHCAHYKLACMVAVVLLKTQPSAMRQQQQQKQQVILLQAVSVSQMLGHAYKCGQLCTTKRNAASPGCSEVLLGVSLHATLKHFSCMVFVATCRMAAAMMTMTLMMMKPLRKQCCRAARWHNVRTSSTCSSYSLTSVQLGMHGAVCLYSSRGFWHAGWGAAEMAEKGCSCLCPAAAHEPRLVSQCSCCSRASAATAE
jgi:hypothetical protein